MITPIETTYKGYRFRSRLEARWAVFFDHVGVSWQYEPQGYTVGPDKRPYLPDFYVPEWRAFVEVKGEAERLDVDLLADLAAVGREALQVLVLGDIPYLETGRIPMHSLLQPAFDIRTDSGITSLANSAFEAIKTLDAGGQRDIRALIRHHRRQTVVHKRFVFVAGQRGCMPFPMGPMYPCPTAGDILAPETCWFVLPMDTVARAYDAARSARFEHGQAPAA